MGTPTRIITRGVVHLIHDGVRHTFRAGDKLPDWAEVTNPRLFAEVPADAGEPTPPQTPATGEPTGEQGGTEPPVKPDDTPTVSKRQSADELRDIAGKLALSTEGTKQELVDRINQKLAEQAAEADDDEDEDEDDAAGGEGDDESDGDRAALEARATEAGIDFDENTTDDELALLIGD
jgi:hypothetical protein